MITCFSQQNITQVPTTTNFTQSQINKDNMITYVAYPQYISFQNKQQFNTQANLRFGDMLNNNTSNQQQISLVCQSNTALMYVPTSLNRINFYMPQNQQGIYQNGIIQQTYPFISQQYSPQNISQISPNCQYRNEDNNAPNFNNCLNQNGLNFQSSVQNTIISNTDKIQSPNFKQQQQTDYIQNTNKKINQNEKTENIIQFHDNLDQNTFQQFYYNEQQENTEKDQQNSIQNVQNLNNKLEYSAFSLQQEDNSQLNQTKQFSSSLSYKNNYRTKCSISSDQDNENIQLKTLQYISKIEQSENFTNKSLSFNSDTLETQHNKDKNEKKNQQQIHKTYSLRDYQKKQKANSCDNNIELNKKQKQIQNEQNNIYQEGQSFNKDDNQTKRISQGLIEKSKTNQNKQGQIKKQQNKIIKEQLLQTITPAEKELLSQIQQISRQNSSKAFLKAYQKFASKEQKYIYNYEVCQNQYYFKVCRDMPIIRIDNPTKKDQEGFFRKFKKFFNGKQLNNNTLKIVMKNKLYGQLFNDFLKDHSEEWLEESKSKNKDDLRIIIKFLQMCHHNMNYLVFLRDNEKLKEKSQIEFDSE